MEIQQLRYLVAAAESKSYARAAKTCFTSRQNVAHSVKSIENELGTIIFVREGNEMVLTPAGRQAVQRARAIVSQVDSMHSMFMDVDAEAEALNVVIGINFLAGIPGATDRYFSDHVGTLHLSEMSPGGGALPWYLERMTSRSSCACSAPTRG